MKLHVLATRCCKGWVSEALADPGRQASTVLGDVKSTQPLVVKGTEVPRTSSTACCCPTPTSRGHRLPARRHRVPRQEGHDRRRVLQDARQALRRVIETTARAARRAPGAGPAHACRRSRRMTSHRGDTARRRAAESTRAAPGRAPRDRGPHPARVPLAHLVPDLHHRPAGRDVLHRVPGLGGPRVPADVHGLDNFEQLVRATRASTPRCGTRPCTCSRTLPVIMVGSFMLGYFLNLKLPGPPPAAGHHVHPGADLALGAGHAVRRGARPDRPGQLGARPDRPRVDARPRGSPTPTGPCRR